MTDSPALWAARATMAERAVQTRHLRRLWGLPRTLIAVTCWPAGYDHARDHEVTGSPRFLTVTSAPKPPGHWPLVA